jgi:hypothetical protein
MKSFFSQLNFFPVTIRCQEVSIKSAIPEARWAHSAVANASQIFLFGGYAGGNYYNDLWRLDTSDTHHLQFQDE